MLPLYMIFYFVVGLHFINNYGALPLQIPVHFNAVGEPDGWLTKKQFAIYHWSFIVVMSGIFAAAAIALRTLPRAKLPLPNKDYWLAPAREKDTLEFLTENLAWLGIVAGGMIAFIDHYIMQASYAGNRSADLSAVSRVLFWGGLMIVVIVLRMMMKLRRPPPESDPKN